MSDDSASSVYSGKSDDPEMERAAQDAVRSFKYLWRELTWEHRRIVPGLELSAIKVPFNDPGNGSEGVEHMWLSDIQFDGVVVSATLLSDPHKLTSVAKSDVVSLRLSQVEDWMYAMEGRVYGGFTIQVLRGRMSPSEREGHDDAWGFEFADPATVEFAPKWKGEANSSPDDEHPMSQNMGPSLAKAIEGDREGFFALGPSGLNTLHSLALGGSLAGVKVLLDLGADPRVRTKDGRTARELAEMMGWPKVVELLRAAEQSR